MKNARLVEGIEFDRYEPFQAQTLIVESAALKGNPMWDPTLRRNHVLSPIGPPPAGGWPVVLQLSGLFGNGANAFNSKWPEENTVQSLARACASGEAPRAVYVFCDAMTAFGGSQFINSAGFGRYEDYIVEDLASALRDQLPVRAKAWCVTGGSSGGYGALHLASQHPELFPWAAALAPDSFFEASLLPEFYAALPAIRQMGSIAGLRKELESGNLLKRRNWHQLANVAAMALCYCADGRGGAEFPIDEETGVLRDEIWKKWKEHDPVVFLEKRAANLKKLKRVFLEVGTRDQFHLQYGSRQIKKIFSAHGVACDYNEFDGDHFDLGSRRPVLSKWLMANWSVI